MKKGAIEIEMIGKILIAVAFLVVVLLIIFLAREESFSIIDKLKEIMRIG